MTGQNKSPPQHTPGPWHANIHGQVFSESDHIGNVIGSEANARLIARAPELLEKLEALIERADDLQAAIEGVTDQFGPLRSQFRHGKGRIGRTGQS